MDLSLDEIIVKPNWNKPNIMKKRKNQTFGRQTNFVVTGLNQIDARNKINQHSVGGITDARQKLSQHSGITDARQKLSQNAGITDARQMLSKVTVTDARQKILAKQTDARQAPAVTDARQKLEQKRSQQIPRQPITDARAKIQQKKQLPTQVTVTGLGRVLSSPGVQQLTTSYRSLSKTIRVDNSDSASIIAGQIIKTIRNSPSPAMSTTSRITDLVITARNNQAKKRKISPVRVPVAEKKAKEVAPIRPQAAATPRSGGVIRLNKSAAATPQTSARAAFREQTYQSSLQMPAREAVYEPSPMARQPAPHKPSKEPLTSSSSVSPLQGYKLIITNLSQMATQEDIVELFGSLGAMRKARLVKPGQAEVVYVKEDDANAAIRQYHMRELDGMPMSVMLAAPPAPPVKPAQPAPLPAADPGPLRFSKGVGIQSVAEIDASLIHQALFKQKSGEKRPGKPVSFTVKI